MPREDIPVAIDRQMLRRVLVNLVRNAVEAIRDARPREGRRAARAAWWCGAEPRDEGVDILVEDDGPRRAGDARERIFDPYFTTKAEGTGLGLAIVKKIVVEHNGSIAARAERARSAARRSSCRCRCRTRSPSPRREDGTTAEPSPSARRARRPARVSACRAIDSRG